MAGTRERPKPAELSGHLVQHNILGDGAVRGLALLAWLRLHLCSLCTPRCCQGRLGCQDEGLLIQGRQCDKPRVRVARGAAGVSRLPKVCQDGPWGAERACSVEEQTSLAFQRKGLSFSVGSFWVPLLWATSRCEPCQKVLSEGSDAFEPLSFFFVQPLPPSVSKGLGTPRCPACLAGPALRRHRRVLLGRAVAVCSARPSPADGERGVIRRERAPSWM